MLHSWITVATSLFIPWKCYAVSSSRKPTLLQGHLEIGGKKLAAICDCREPMTDLNNGALPCNPAKLLISTDHGTRGLTSEQVRKYYGQPRNLEMVEVSKQSFSCLDDRIAVPVLMTPGADLGEFLLGLAVYASFVVNTPKENITPEVTEDMLARYIETLPVDRPFCHCTDDAAVAHLQKTLGTARLDLENPKSPDVLLPHMVKPENIGDVHLRTLLANPGKYRVAPPIAQAAVQAFYRLLWNGSQDQKEKLLLDVLPGDHDASAFVEIEEGSTCNAAGQAPLMQPRVTAADGSSASAYLWHPSAVGTLRRDMSQFFIDELGGESSTVTIDQFYQRMEKYGLEWLEATMSSTDSDLKFFRITLV